MFAYLAKL